MLSFSCCLLLVLVTQFTELNRESASTKEPADAHASVSIAEQPLIKQAIGGLSTMKDVFASGQSGVAVSENNRAAKFNEVPATLVWIRMSKSFLAKNLERDVDRKKPVRDYILGTTIAGESRTTGKTRFVLYPNDSHALGEVEFVGEVHARTVGHNGPATLHYDSDSTFRARKRVTIGESGLSTTAAVANAPTRLTATSIQTSLPGLRGMISQRIAWRRVARSQSQADAIASNHTATDIRDDLDKKLNDSIAAIQNKVQLQLAKLEGDGENGTLRVRSRSTPDYIEVALCRRGTGGNEIRLPSFPINGNPEIAVRIHRTTLALAMSDPEVREMVTPLMGNLLKKQILATGDVPVAQLASLQVANWSTGGEWTAVDLTAPGGPASTMRVAIAEDFEGKQTR
jgi:hypothetical protein